MHGTTDFAKPLTTVPRTGVGTSEVRQPPGAIVQPVLSSDLKALEATIATRDPDMISVDLFDTLLLRGTEPMRTRWKGAARRSALLLNRHGNRISADAIVTSRAVATRAAMSMTNVLGGPEDVPLATIFASAAAMLGLQQTAVQVFLAAELAEERARLSLNRPLFDLLARHRAGRRIVVTSDTNLSAQMLRGLLDHFEAPVRFDTIRTSADLGLTKQRGSIFPALVKHEGVLENRILHIGDDAVADVEMPSRYGIAPFHLQRRGPQMLVRRARKFLVKAIHGDR